VALNVIFFGPPAAGKGTQAERFAREHGIPKITTGEILREQVASGTALGEQVKAVMDRGDLVGDDLIIAIVEDRLSRPDAARGFVLDGFPRTVAQASALDAMLADRDPVIVVEIRVPDQELVRRVLSRRICSQCGQMVSAFDADGKAAERCANCGGELVTRADDTEAVVRNRLKVYWRDTQPLVAYYQSRPTFRTVNGAQDPDRVRDELVQAVADVLGKPVADLGAAGDARPEKNA
jgi:adenylate kinase